MEIIYNYHIIYFIYMFYIYRYTWTYIFSVFIFIEFFGVTLANKIKSVSGVYFCNTASLYCTVCSPPQVTCHQHLSLLHPLLPPSILFPSGNHRKQCLSFFLCLIPSFFSPSHPLQFLFPLTVVSLFSVFMSLFLFCLLVYFVHSVFI